MDTAVDTRSSMNAQDLVKALSESAHNDIAGIDAQCERQLEQLRGAAAAEIESFEHAQEQQAAAAVLRATARIHNRFGVEQKKQRLAALEAFIWTSVAAALKEIPVSCGAEYADFITMCLQQHAGRFKADSVVIMVLPEHRAHIERVLRELQLKIPIRESSEPGNGGIILDDTAAGRSLNWSLDRIVYRKFSRIRRCVYEIIVPQMQTI